MDVEQQEVIDDTLSKISHDDSDAEKNQVHNCDLCGRSFLLLSSLSQHMRKHTGEKPYKCPHCQHRSAQKGSLKAHIRTHKIDGRSQSAGGNGEEVEDEGDKEGGVPEEQGGCSSPTESTSACNKMVNGEETTKTRKKGVKKERTNSEGGKQCSLCRKRLRSQAELEQHMQDFHDTSQEEDHLQAETRNTHPIQENSAMDDCPNMEEAEKENELGKGDFPCDQCDQVFTQAWFLKAHMKKHQNTRDHGCRICGRRFREAWFLRSHMKTHNTKSKPKTDSELPVTVNEVTQVEASLVNDVCLYELCAKCGNFFHDRNSLQLHEQVHKNKDNTSNCGDERPSPLTKRYFLESLNLRVAGEIGKLSQERLGKRIPELDPVSSYQAWQLATRGRVIEVSEKALGWEERLADADVVYDKKKGEYVLLRQEKRKKQTDDTLSTPNKKKRGTVAQSLSNTSTTTTTDHQRNEGQTLTGSGSAESLSDSEYRPSSHHSRKNSQNKTSECLECGKGFRTQQQMVIHMLIRHGSMSESINGVSLQNLFPNTRPSPSKPVDPAEDQCQRSYPEGTDQKPYTCEHCDFSTAESAAMTSHIRIQHTAISNEALSSESTQSHTPSTSHSGFPRLRNALLQQSSWPYTTSSNRERAALSGNMLSSKCIDENADETSKELGEDLFNKMDASLLNLSGDAENDKAGARDKVQNGLVRHQCPYCSYATLYPEVLWIHQRIAHKIDSTTLIPKWAPKNGAKGPKTILDFKRRTGPPPFLEGKDCPPLPQTRILRTSPPELKPRGTKNQPHSRCIDSTYSQSKGQLVGRPSHSSKQKSSRSRGDEVKSTKKKANTNQYFSSSTSRARPAPSPQKTGNRKTKKSLMETSLLPQEGLGFMLTSKQKNPHTQTSSQLEPPAQDADISAGYDLWSRLSLAGSSSHFQTKKQQTGDSPGALTDIYSFLKNCSPQDLAALYQQWGFNNMMMDQAGSAGSGQKEGEYVCPVCGKSFSQPSHYRTHMRSHTAGHLLPADLLECNGLLGVQHLQKPPNK